MLRLSHVSKAYQHGGGERLVLDDVSLDVAPGELTVLSGPSGSGKSTLLLLAGGLLRPSAGEVEVLGQPVHAMSAEDSAALRLHRLSYVFQDYNLLQTLTAVENVALPLELAGHALGEAREAALTSLERVGMAERADQRPDTLSGGEQQRVAIARALVTPRGLLLADEITGALDSESTRIIVALLAELAAEGATCLVATHDPEVAAAGRRVVHLLDGRVVKDERCG